MIRSFFFLTGFSAVVCGAAVLFSSPLAFIFATLSIIAGLVLVVCGFRAEQYIDQDKYESENQLS